MDCASVEQRLSDYLEAALPAEERNAIREHVQECENCSALLGELRALLSDCSCYPAMELDPDLLEKILLRTSGRPRTLSLREQVQEFFHSILTPKFAAGAVLAALFFTLSLRCITPQLSGTYSALSAMQLFSLLDRGAQFAYGEGLKVFDKKDRWLAEFQFFRNVSAQKMRFMLERFHVPVEEGRKKPADPAQEKKDPADGKYSRILSWQACVTQKFAAGRS